MIRLQLSGVYRDEIAFKSWESKGTPQSHPPPRKKALLRDDSEIMVINKPLMRLLMSEVACRRHQDAMSVACMG